MPKIKSKKGDQIQLEITNQDKSSPILDVKKQIELGENFGLFSSKKTIYLEMHRGNLLQYIGAGIIYPSKYSKQKAFSDTQTVIENAFILSNGLISDATNDIILIQLAATSIDESLLNINDGIAFYSGLIPISRILKIFVANLEIKKLIIDSAVTRDGGFLPEELISVGFPKQLAKVKNVGSALNSRDWSNELILYDKILGLIVGIRNFNLLTLNHQDSIKSISDHTFYSLNAIDKYFAEQFDGGRISEFYNWLFLQSCPSDRILLKWIFTRVFIDLNFGDKDTNEFEQLCYQSNVFKDELKLVDEIFSTLKNSVKRKSVFSEILKIQSKQALPLYIFAYLRVYGSFQNPENARLELIKLGIDKKYSEYAFAVINFFFGYKLLRNSEDRLTISDNIIETLISSLPKPSLKLELTTQFDYKIIDNVFNFVFGSKVKLAENDYRPYSNIKVQSLQLKSNIKGYNYTETLIYGKIYQSLTKVVNPFDELLLSLGTFPEDIFAISELGLFCYRSGLKMRNFSIPDLFIGELSFKKAFSFSKKELINSVQSNKIDIEELKQRISLSQKHKEY